jgi:hypothetical protein
MRSFHCRVGDPACALTSCSTTKLSSSSSGTIVAKKSCSTARSMALPGKVAHERRNGGSPEHR